MSDKELLQTTEKQSTGKDYALNLSPPQVIIKELFRGVCIK